MYIYIYMSRCCYCRLDALPPPCRGFLPTHNQSSPVHTLQALLLKTPNLHVEYVAGRIKYGILFISSLCYEYSSLEYVHTHVIYRVDQAEFVIRILVAASQKYEYNT